MPIRKFRSVADMPPPPLLPPLTARTLEAACELMELAWRLHPVHRPPGVRKFRSFDDAKRFQTDHT